MSNQAFDCQAKLYFYHIPTQVWSRAGECPGHWKATAEMKVPVLPLPTVTGTAQWAPMGEGWVDD